MGAPDYNPTPGKLALALAIIAISGVLAVRGLVWLFHSMNPY